MAGVTTAGGTVLKVTALGRLRTADLRPPGYPGATYQRAAHAQTLTTHGLSLQKVHVLNRVIYE